MIFKIFLEKNHYRNDHYQEIRENPEIHPSYHFCDFPSKLTIQAWKWKFCYFWEFSLISMGKLNFEYLKCKNWNVSIQFESEDEHLDGGTLKKSAEFLSGVVRSAGSYKIRVRRRPKCDLNINSVFSVSVLVSIKTAIFRLNAEKFQNFLFRA